MKIVITGATSFIGMHLTAHLLAQNHDVTVVVRPDSVNLSRLPSHQNLHTVFLPLGEVGEIKRRISSPVDVFLHLAWQGVRGVDRNNADLQRQNYEMSINVIQTAGSLGCRVFLGAGSQAEYGCAHGPTDEATPLCPTCEYGKAKALTWEKGAQLADLLGMRMIWPRIFSVYGPHDNPTTLVMTGIKKMMKNEELRLTECTQLWDFLYVQDAVLAIEALIQSHTASGAFNVASGHTRPLQEFIMDMRLILQSSSNLLFGSIIGERASDLFPVVHKLEKEINWKPQTSFSEGILWTARTMMES